MKNINTLTKEIENKIYNDIILRAADYTHSPDSYICDIISELADSETSIYYSDLINWLKDESNSFEYIESAAAEFGVDSQNFDFSRLIQQGQYYGNEQTLYNNINDFGKIWLLYYLKDIENITELTDEQADFIDELEVDSNERFSDILERFKNI